MKKEIPTHDPYTGQLNPYYQDLTGQPNPLHETNYDNLETYYIKEEVLANGKSRFYPTMKVSLDENKSWNEENLLKKWYPKEENDYCDSYDLAKLVIEKNKEFRFNIFTDVEKTIIHEII